MTERSSQSRRIQDEETASLQAALRDSEHRFRSVFANAAIGKAMASPELRFLAVNRVYCEMFGYTEGEMLAMNLRDLAHPDDTSSIVELLRELFEGKRSSFHAVRAYRHKLGHAVYGDLTVTLVRDEHGAPSYFLGEVVDVTERLRTEALLRDREAKLAEAQRVAHLGSWEYDIATKRSLWSDEMYRIFHLDPARFDPSRDDARSRIHPDDLAASGLRVHETITKGTPYEYEFRVVLDDGEVRHLWTIGRAELGSDGKPSRVYGIVQDITERKRAEEALRASEQRFRNLYTQAPVLMTVVDPQGRFREVSNFWLERMGYAREEVIGRDAVEFVTPETRERLNEAKERALVARELVLRSMPMEAVRKDGTTVSALVTSMLELDSGGTPSGIVTVGLDVSHIRRAEEAMRESEARYRALVEHAPEAITVLDASTGIFIDANESAERLFGQPRERIVGMRPTDFSPPTQPDGRSSAEAALAHVERARAGEVVEFEWICTHSSGRDMICLIRLSRLPAKDRELLRSSVTEITELKMLQERARHDDRMASIGVLAAGVAHEIGNPLLALSMSVQSLERKVTDEYALRKLPLIREHVDRIAKIVRQMGDLARPLPTVRSECDLNRLVERSLEILRYDRRAREVAVTFEPGEGVPAVVAVEDQLVQVCLNLGLNALDAVAANPPGRPRSLVVRTRRVEHCGRAFVRTTFADSGSGIPDDARPHVFQPFFTTKAPGKGTGLGLSVTHRIVEEHGGKLSFDCPPSGGTEFAFEIPVEERP